MVFKEWSTTYNREGRKVQRKDAQRESPVIDLSFLTFDF